MSKDFAGDFNMFPIRKILFPTDFSDHSVAAFEVACGLARDYGAELLVVHVYQQTAIFAPDGIVVAVPPEDTDALRAKLAEFRSADSAVRIDHDLLEGNPVDNILKAARDRAIDLIVMGTHGTTGLTRLLMGSVAESVLRKAPCPVLTIRTPVRTHEKAGATVASTA
jgi:nucleotide-binding universal stress UspA family protein